ncbi:MAG: GMC oxidoreductase [Pseudonocardiaceae bacterium]
MPVIDLNDSCLGDAQPLVRCDVCIVGTGPAGATLARELSGSGLRVTILESGGLERSPDADRLEDIESVGRPRVEPQWSVRNRVVGGSSYTWGGRCAPLDAVDFEERPWVPASGWPLRLEDLVPFLDRAASHLGLAVGSGFSDDRFWELAGRRVPATAPDPAVLLPFFWQFSRDDQESYPFEYMRFGRHLAKRLGRDVTLVAGATALRVDPVESGRAVRSVEYARPDGRRRTLAAGTVVLCAGGIGNARILLSSDTVRPSGLGNDRDLVGRYLMDHLRGAVGTFDVAGSAALQKRFGRYNVRARMFRAGLRLSPEVQRAEGLLNCAAWLGEEWAQDDPWAALRRVLGGRPQLPADLLALVRNGGFLARGARDYFVERNGVPRKLDALELVCMVEQRPDPDSRITLSDRRDRFGMALPRIDWRVNENETRTMRRTAELLAAELVRMGYPAPRLAEWVGEGAGFPPSFVDVAHPTGTTRMSADPGTGVVDANGQVHGVNGLYVAGSSVFPTGGHCNPTHMIVAMAIRLADHLRDRVADACAVPASVLGAVGPGTVLVTGATGRIGRVVVADLLARGHRVRATTSQEPPADAGKLEWRRLDLLEAQAADVDRIVTGCEAVVHLAAEIGGMDRMQRVNAEATRLLAEAAERAGVGAFCYTSSVSVYGSGRRRTAHEDAPVLTVERDVRSEYLALDYVRAYGRTKLAGERALHAAARSVSYVLLRPTVVVDVEQLIATTSWGRVERALKAHRHAHHVYVRDVSDALIWSMKRALAAEPGSVETFNLSEDGIAEPTHGHFLRRVRAATGDRRRVVVVPGIADWLHDMVRFRMLTARNPLWRMRFPDDRIREAGYRPRFGMAHARAMALEELRQRSRVASIAEPDARGDRRAGRPLAVVRPAPNERNDRE